MNNPLIKPNNFRMLIDNHGDIFNLVSFISTKDYEETCVIKTECNRRICIPDVFHYNPLLQKIPLEFEQEITKIIFDGQ
jgi:hypothetical protein